jgi:N-glycosylase/DNA lyase
MSDKPPARQIRLAASPYNLAATLASGQAFRWHQQETHWEGVVQGHWVRLSAQPNTIVAESAAPCQEWSWLENYLQIHQDLEGIINTFPKDNAMQGALAACPGLRLLRQDPWECLISFICSSTKQIVQIQQIVELLCQRYGTPIVVPPGHAPVFDFPTPQTLARVSEKELRGCKMGFRAPYLLVCARRVSDGTLNLEALRHLELAKARESLMDLPGVGEKIANCVLLFAYGFPQAFPVDVWVMKALRQLYFPKRKPTKAQLIKFIAKHFGPHAGYAQQYLFHYMRTMANPKSEGRNPIGRC